MGWLVAAAAGLLSGFSVPLFEPFFSVGVLVQVELHYVSERVTDVRVDLHEQLDVLSRQAEADFMILGLVFWWGSEFGVVHTQNGSSSTVS